MASSLVISLPFLATGDNYTFPDMPPLTMSVESNFSSRVVTYTGTNLIQTYVDLIQTFLYSNSLEEPETGVRVAMIQVFTPADTPGNVIGSNIASVSIQVIPRNDNPPEFRVSFYVGSIPENAPPGTSIGVTVVATDADVFGNTNITFTTSDTFFTVDPISGVVSNLRPLDVENTRVYQFTILATDNDIPVSLTSSVLVYVNITDINDNSPVFNQSSYSVSTREDTAIGAILLTVSATDGDVTEANSGITYMISAIDEMGIPGSGTEPITPTGPSNLINLPFVINSITGDIALTDQLDFDAGITSYDFMVVATDTSSSPLSTFVPVQILIMDTNDNSPQFVNAPFSPFFVFEDTPFPSPIVFIMASDADTGINAQIEFTLQGTTTFSINGTTGLLSLNGPLDFETSRMHTFTVVATDLGSPPLSSQETIAISVGNINDNPPMFLEASYNFNGTENAPFLEAVEATDADGDFITYREVLGFGPEFTLRAFAGEISSVFGFTPDFESQRSYFLVVEAFDGIFSTFVNVSIIIEDLNDLPPVFLQDRYMIAIPESFPVGASVIQVAAVDRDTLSNALIEYNIQPQQVTFSINETTGIIFISGPLDFDTPPMSYFFNVTARNPVFPFYEDSATVSITLLDVNDFHPVLSIGQINLNFTENSDPISIASSIQISDGDSSEQLLVECSAVLTGSCTSTGVTLCNETIFVNETLADQLGLLVQNVDGPNGNNLTISGNSSIFSYQALLQTLQYGNFAAEPDPRVRSVQIQCQDYDFVSNTLEISIALQLLNEFCPTITTSVNTINFTEGSITLLVGHIAQFVFVDQDSAPHNTLQGLRITLDNHLDSPSEFISITNHTGLMAIDSTDSARLTQTIMLQTPQSQTPLPIHVFSRALSSLVYTNNLSEPTVVPRHISVIPVDTAEGCTPVNVTINILPQNDNPPVLLVTQSSALQYQEESGPLAFATEAGLTIRDMDHNDLFPIQSSTVVLDGILDTTLNELLGYNASLLPVGVSATITTSQEGIHIAALTVLQVVNFCPNTNSFIGFFSENRKNYQSLNPNLY